MRSVVDGLREETRAAARDRPPQALIEQAFALGALSLDLLCAARGIPRPEARRVFERMRRQGRRPSACLLFITQ